MKVSEIFLNLHGYTECNHRKSLIQHCERAKLRLHFKSEQKWSILGSFWKPVACSQTVLPGQKLVIGVLTSFRWKVQILLKSTLLAVASFEMIEFSHQKSEPEIQLKKRKKKIDWTINDIKIGTYSSR